MKMKLNRITMGLVSALFVFALMGCNLEVPSSVRIKSKPGLYISLGSPFAGSEMSLSEYLSTDGLKKQLASGDSGDIDLLDWKVPGDPDLQAYRVRYPVADININLSEYVDSMDVASNLESASGGWIPGTGSEIEIPLPLDSMSFAHDVKGVTISVTLTFTTTTDPATPPAATETGSATVPNGVTVTFKGAVSSSTKNGNKWTSDKIEPSFEPATDKISIGVTVPVGTWFSPKLEFDWEEATISLGAGGKKEGEYKLDFSNFRGFMGEGISFKEITGYMYVQKPDEDTLDADAEVKLIWNKGTTTEEQDVTTIGTDFPLDWKESFTRPASQYDIDLTDLFTYPLTFHYELTLNEVTIKQTDNKDGKLTVDMVILLPLEFTLEGDSVKSNVQGYKKLNLEALKGLGEGGDLFGRTGAESGDDDLFDNLEGVQLIFSDYRNEIIEGLSFGYLLKNGDEWKRLDFESLDGSGTEIELTPDDIEYPFSPKFELLVKDEATLKILRPEDGKDAEIDLNIAVQAETDLDYPIKF